MGTSILLTTNFIPSCMNILSTFLCIDKYVTNPDNIKNNITDQVPFDSKLQCNRNIENITITIIPCNYLII